MRGKGKSSSHLLQFGKLLIILSKMSYHLISLQSWWDYSAEVWLHATATSPLPKNQSVYHIQEHARLFHFSEGAHQHRRIWNRSDCQRSRTGPSERTLPGVTTLIRTLNTDWKALFSVAAYQNKNFNKWHGGCWFTDISSALPSRVSTME